jgi:hypothetical protein
LEPIIPRGSLVTTVATVQPYALPQRRADQVFQVFLNGNGAVRDIEAFPDYLHGRKLHMLFQVAISSRTFRDREKNRRARILPNL